MEEQCVQEEGGGGGWNVWEAEEDILQDGQFRTETLNFGAFGF